MFEELYRINALTSERDFYLVVALCCICAVVLREFIGSIYICLALLPSFIFSSVLMLYLVRQAGVLPQASADSQVIASTALGVTTAFVTASVILDLCFGLTDWRMSKIFKKRFRKG